MLAISRGSIHTISVGLKFSEILLDSETDLRLTKMWGNISYTDTVNWTCDRDYSVLANVNSAFEYY